MDPHDRLRSFAIGLALSAIAWTIPEVRAAEGQEASADPGSWKCSASGLANAEYDGSGSAYIHLGRYRSGHRYPVKLNEARTEASGTTADGTPFKCIRVR